MSTKGGIESSQPTLLDAGGEAAGFPRLIKHLKNPEHLVAYLLFSAWLKYMDILSWLPVITVGG